MTYSTTKAVFPFTIYRTLTAAERALTAMLTGDAETDAPFRIVPRETAPGYLIEVIDPEDGMHIGYV